MEDLSLLGGDHLILCDLKIGEPKRDIFPDYVLKELSLKKDINGYYSPVGDQKLRKIILLKYYPHLNLENIAITPGALGALDLVFRSSLTPGMDILIPDPGFPPISKMSILAEAHIKKYFLNLEDNSKTSINWLHLKSQLSKKPTLLFINTPHNPTGKILTSEDFDSFLKLLAEYPQVYFVLDEVYREFIYSDQSHFDFSRLLDRGYIIGSFSKMYPMPGARVGWVTTSLERMKKLIPYLENAIGPSSSFGQEIAKIFLKKDELYQSHYFEALKMAEKILDRQGVSYLKPAGAFFIFINYKMNTSKIILELATLGAVVAPGSIFGQQGENYIRASFAQNNDILKKGFTIIADHWAKTQGNHSL